jgi:signal transduction histidine kinase
MRWLPRRTARLRLTVLYGAAFLVCGAAVLAVVMSVLYAHTDHAGAATPQLKGSATAVLRNRIPVADVRHSGGYDVFRMTVRVPAGDVRRTGRYDIITQTGTIPQASRKLPLTAAQRAALLSRATFQVHYDLRQVIIVCAVALAFIALAAAIIGWIIAGRVLRPLSTMTATARRIAASSLHERLALRGPDDELKELGDTLDNLFARLEASFEAQRRFAANASHELRTPLTRERTLLQVTLADPGATPGTWREVSRELLASNAEQERLIEALITLASGEADVGEREPLDLADIADEALTGAGHPGLDIEASLEPAGLDGDPLLVQQLVTNLVDNATRHNVPGGEVTVTTRTSGGRAVLSVANSGPVIPPAEVDRLFQPFQRFGPRPARREGGHGLGLSIVRAIAAAHGARLAARARPEGGLVVEVTFPPPAPGSGDGQRSQAPESLRRG